MSSRGRRQSAGRPARTSSSGTRGSSGSSSRGASSKSRASREPAEERRTRYVRKKSSATPVILASVGLGVVALVLFIVMSGNSRKKRIDEAIREIESEPIVETASQEDQTVTNAEAVAAVLAEQGKIDEGKDAAAEAAAKEEKRRRERSRYEVRNLGHLETTSEDQRAEIDELIVALVQLDDIRASDNARDELISIRKPAVPRLLNRFVGLSMDNEDHIQMANIVHRTLSEIARLDEDNEISFIPTEEGTGRMVKMRQNSIKRWFEWWGNNETTFE